MTTISVCRPAFAALARPSVRSIAAPAAARFNSSQSSNNKGSVDQLEELILQSKTRQPAPVSTLSSTIGMIAKRQPSSFKGGYGLGESDGEWKPHGQGDHHLHVYSHKHNTHITFTRPDKGPIISLSCGNIGFKKAQRGTYDAGYQLAAKVFKMIEDKRIMPKQVELIYRGFGIGREAVTKALLSSEGRSLRPVINRVTDSTRLKFGGTRSPKPRRLVCSRCVVHIFRFLTGCRVKFAAGLLLVGVSQVHCIIFAYRKSKRIYLVFKSLIDGSYSMFVFGIILRPVK